MRCEDCRGYGRINESVTRYEPSASGYIRRVKSFHCPSCGGTGQRANERRSAGPIGIGRSQNDRSQERETAEQDIDAAHHGPIHDKIRV